MIIKVQSIVPASISIFITIIFVFSSLVTISSFAQSDNNNHSTNQTLENMSQAPNQTNEVIKGNDNDTESNDTNVVKNIGKNLTEVAKKLDDTISKKLHDLAK